MSEQLSVNEFAESDLYGIIHTLRKLVDKRNAQLATHRSSAGWVLAMGSSLGHSNDEQAYQLIWEEERYLMRRVHDAKVWLSDFDLSVNLNGGENA